MAREGRQRESRRQMMRHRHADMPTGGHPQPSTLNAQRSTLNPPTSEPNPPPSTWMMDMRRATLAGAEQPKVTTRPMSGHSCSNLAPSPCRGHHRSAPRYEHKARAGLSPRSEVCVSCSGKHLLPPRLSSIALAGWLACWLSVSAGGSLDGVRQGGGDGAAAAARALGRHLRVGVVHAAESGQSRFSLRLRELLVRPSSPPLPPAPRASAPACSNNRCGG